MKSVKGFNKLTLEQQELLIKTNERHKSGVGNDYKYGWTLVSVKLLGKNLKVVFENEELLQYMPSGDSGDVIGHSALGIALNVRGVEMYKVELVLPKDIKPLQEKLTDIVTDLWIKNLGSKEKVDYLIEKLETQESEEFL